MIDVSTSANYIGDCRVLLRDLPDACVQTCITSPPYWGLRDYGHDGQIGLEPTPEAFVLELVAVFREVRRVLRDDGTLWLNLGDSYAHDSRGGHSGSSTKLKGRRNASATHRAADKRGGMPTGYKPKDLIGQPWMVAFALRADGWYLRSDIIWHKANPMPEAVTDRPSKCHEYLFLLAKSERYFYDAAAVREPIAGTLHHGGDTRTQRKASANAAGSRNNESWATSMRNRGENLDGKRNRRSVWTTISEPFAGAHFATFPPKLIEPCVLAGSRPGDLVLDPFFGSGTTGEVAEKHGRRWIGFDLGYDKLAKERTAQRSLMGRLT